MPNLGPLGGHLNLPRVPDLSEIIGFVHRNILAPENPSVTLVRRIPQTTSSSGSAATTSCSNNPNADTCAKPTDISLALPIGLGVAIPMGIAAVLLIFLHQRNKKRQRIEDRRDEEKYKSLDFGTSLHFTDGKKKKGANRGQYEDPAMTRRQMRGLSLEAGPYMFPDNLHDSRASLHSMSRNAAFDEFNPYRPADEISLRASSPGPRMRGDNGSIGSSTLRRQDVPSRTDSTNTSHTNLLRHPQPPPKSLSPSNQSPYMSSADSFEKPPLAGPLAGEFKEFGNADGLAPAPIVQDRDPYFDYNAQNMRSSNNYLGQVIHSRDQSTENRSAPASGNPHFSWDEKPTSYPSSHPDSTGSTLVNTTPSQTTPKASISEYDAPKIGVSDYDAMPNAVSPPVAPPKNEPLPSAKSLPAVKGLPSTPRPNRKPSVEQKDQAPPTPPKQTTPPKRQSPPQQQPQQPNQYQQNSHPQRSSSNQHYSNEYSAQPRQSNENYSNNYSNYQTNSYTADNSNYGEYNPYSQRESTGSYGSVPTRGQSLANQMPVVDEYPQQDQYPQPPPEPQDWVQDMDYDPRRLSVFMRPLPPDDPHDTPEVRANRIRSFYKEYFDKNQYMNQGGPNTQYQGGYQQGAVPYPYQLQAGDYYDYEDYGQEHMNAATVYDPETGGFIVGNAPYAEPVTRRAMTPPPRAPPRFRGNGPPSVPGSRAGSRPGSNQTWNMPPRGASAMSYRGRTQQRKPMPPPTALISLPTPHKLNADSVLTALDFAPPVSFRDRQAGRRPDSPMGTNRPYSPAVRAHVPLMSSFDDLAVIPSPHALRKSGIYTSLDFAPPRRFKNDGDGMSDVASMRSGRSGMSAVSTQQLYAMRTGAYRVSRLPPELAGSKDDILQSLRPTWDLRGPEQLARSTGRDTPTDFKTLRFT